jgi:excinuclease UvrABC nuclease subunit
MSTLHLIQTLLTKLLRAEPMNFPPIRGRLDAPTDPGVYIIYSPESEVLHVGSTPRARNGLRQRLKNHLQSKSSFVRSYLAGDGSKLRQGYRYKYLIVPDSRERALLEALAIGTLCPKHLGLGKSNS